MLRFLQGMSVLLVVAFLPGLVDASSTREAPSPEGLMESASRAYEQGNYGHAVSSWQDAARLFEALGRSGEQSDALARLAQVYASLGRHQEAVEHVEFALRIARESGDQARIASVLRYAGNVYLAAGSTDTASEYLNEGLDIARKLESSDLHAAILNNLGNLLASKKKHMEALDAYLECARLGGKSGDKALTAVAFTNAGMISMQQGHYEKSKAFLDKAIVQTRNLVHSHDKAYALINIGLGYNGLRGHLVGETDQIATAASNALGEATNVAEAIDDLRAKSYAWGYMGKLYEGDNRYEEALELTRRAVFAAQQINALEALYRWEWQRGRLLKGLGRTEEAIFAYRRAVDTLQSIRHGMYATYGSQQFSFRDSVGPVYFELIDLLLQHADSVKEPDKVRPYLLEAREKVELLKVAELQDYFQDECVDVARGRITSLDAVSKEAAIVYPLMLPDRTELLVSLPNGLKRFSIPVDAKKLATEVALFRRRLTEPISKEYLPHAQKLYDWLIRPFEIELATSTVDTLVFVPDGPLRTIPMAALHDGEGFLIERYAVAITPSLNVTDPRPIQREGIKLLAVGLTKGSQGFPPLPYVADELKNIRELYSAKVLLNQDFLLSNLEKALIDESFGIVHIASHGRFEDEIQETFLLTYDDKLTLERLDHCVGYFRFREEPLELLTLSACETAAGDERAALGLAGVAVKAGARSAVATLWTIHDQATSLLVGEFYRQLLGSSVSRAVALQRAQLKLINDARYDHPAYWSPFLLINNWL